MKRINFYKFAAVIICSICAFTVVSCSNDDDDTAKLRFSPNKVTLAIGGSERVIVKGGTQAYTAKTADEKTVTTSVDKDTVWVKGVKAGKVTILVTDAKKLTGSFDVTVVDGILLNQSKVKVAVGKEQTIGISGGTTPYTAAVKDAAIATATIQNDKLIVKGVKAGNTTVTVSDANKKTATLIVSVTK